MIMRSVYKWLLPSLLRVYVRDKVDYWALCRSRELANRPIAADHVGDLYLKATQFCGGYLSFQANLVSLRPHNRRLPSSINYTSVHNGLPNSGSITVPRNFESAHEVVSAFPDSTRRRQGIEGVPGFAPDDAVFDEATEAWELWSNSGLAGVIASFAYANYKNASVLDLGCGPAHLFPLLTGYGMGNYVGIDGNPLILQFIPHVKEHANQFHILNLNEEIRLFEGTEPLKLDIICSFEVLEHIEEDRIDNLIRTIRNHMHPKSVAFCTASLQEQIDIHVLIRNRDWWLERFSRFGLHPHPEEKKLGERLGLAHPFNWNTANTNVFVLRARI